MMMMSPLKLMALCLLGPLVVSGAIVESDPVVQTTSGLLIGQKLTINNGNVYRFLGVPFAQPPVDVNRFEKPQELVNHTEKVVMAKQFQPTCVQMRHLTKAISSLLDVDEDHNISEDCLYLNIYMPVESNGSPLPIMVWLPGEGFDFADARQFNGAYLALMGKAIVITVQYRVGVFGFLKNNAGLWDQLAALKWIRANAASLGGNPDNVTLFGRFTGSMSISILLSSPQVIQSPDALFTRAILMSGIAVGNWVFDKMHDDKMSQVLKSHHCSSVECLKSLSAEKLLNGSGFGWKPTIDGELVVEEPLSALHQGHFPRHVQSIMLGTNRFEGSLCLIKHLAVDEPFYQKLIQNNITTQEYEKAIRQDLEMFYGDDTHFGRLQSGIIKDRAMYVEFCSELLINSHMAEYDTLLHKLSTSGQYALRNVYEYKLDYKPSFSIAPDFINSSIHGDDVILAFGLAFKSQSASSKQDRKISSMMVALFSDFAHTGSPFHPTDVIEIKSTPDSFFTLQITNFQMSLVVCGFFGLAFLILLFKLLQNCSQSQTSSNHIKGLLRNYNEFH